MRALLLTAAVLVAGSILSAQATAAERSPFHPAVSERASHGASVTLAAHHGYSRHGYPGYGHSPYGHAPYPHRGPSPYYHGYHCGPPVIVRPPVVVPYPAYPYGYHRGYGYYHSGVSVNTGRVGFSIAF